MIRCMMFLSPFKNFYAPLTPIELVRIIEILDKLLSTSNVFIILRLLVQFYFYSSMQIARKLNHEAKIGLHFFLHFALSTQYFSVTL